MLTDRSQQRLQSNKTTEYTDTFTLCKTVAWDALREKIVAEAACVYIVVSRIVYNTMKEVKSIVSHRTALLRRVMLYRVLLK